MANRTLRQRGVVRRVSSASRVLSGDEISLLDPALEGTVVEQLLRLPLGEISSLPGRAFDMSLLLLASKHRLIPLILEELVEEEKLQWFEDLQRSVAFVQLGVERELLRVLEILDGAGIEVRVLKGLATGRLDYPTPSLRQTGDVDVLVRAEDLARTEAVLRAALYESHPHSNHVDPRLVAGVTLMSPAGVEVDIHSALSRYHPETGSEELFAGGESLEHGGVALTAELRLIHAAAHLVWSPPGRRRASGLVDIGRILDTRPVDFGSVARSATALGISPLVGVGLRLEAGLRRRERVPDIFGPVPRLERFAFFGSSQRVATEHLLALSSSMSWADRVSYLRQFLLPDRSVLRSRGGASKYYGRLVHGGDE